MTATVTPDWSLDALWGAPAWPVAGAYRIVNGAVQPDGDVASEYVPLRAGELATDLLGVGQRPTEADLLTFVARWGLLGYQSLAAHAGEQPAVPHGEPVTWFLGQAAAAAWTARLALGLARDAVLPVVEEFHAVHRVEGGPLPTGDAPASTVVRVPDLLGPVDHPWGLATARDATARRIAPEQRARELATEMIALLVNRRLAHVRPALVTAAAPEGFRRAFLAHTPLEASFLQLSDALSRRTSGGLRRCARSGCGGIFVVHDDRQRFCPPPAARAESRCAAAERQRRRRARAHA